MTEDAGSYPEKTIALGWLLGDQWTAVRQYAHLLEYGVIAAIALAILWLVWRRLAARG